MSDDNYFKSVCNNCGGHVEFPEESEGATVACPHCQKDLFLYRTVRAVKATTTAADNPVPPDATPKPSSTGVDFFGKIEHRETALTVIRWSFGINLVFCVVTFASGLFDPLYFLTAAVSLVPTLFLGIHKSRAAAVMLAIWAFIGLAHFILQGLFDHLIFIGAIFQLLYAVTTFRAVEATFKLHGRFSASSQGNTHKMSGTGEAVLGVACALVAAGVLVGSAMWRNGSKAHPTTNAGTVNPSDSQQSARYQYQWNTSDIDAASNGNVAVAINFLKRNPSISGMAIAPSPQLMTKKPWEYLGKVVKVTGVIAVVQDFPAGNDKMFGGDAWSDIVVICDDETIVELFCMKPSGSLAKAITANLYGYPVGVLEVPNGFGAKDTHLIMVGNSYDNLGSAQ